MEENTESRVVRAELTETDVYFKKHGLAPSDQRSIKHALRTLHNFELMAVNIYRFQITRSKSEQNRRLLAAMLNEMTHYQDFTYKLYEYGFRPSVFRIFFWLVGLFLGLGSRILGDKWVLKTGIWVEKNAVVHYGHLLNSVKFDEDTRKMVEKDRADEQCHIETWQEILKDRSS